MKNNAFVRLPLSEAAKMPWDTFAVERLDAVWRNFDASVTCPDIIYVMILIIDLCRLKCLLEVSESIGLRFKPPLLSLAFVFLFFSLLFNFLVFLYFI